MSATTVTQALSYHPSYDHCLDTITFYFLVNITISPTGHNIGIAGENFFLKCSVDVTYIPHNISHLSIQWLFGPKKISLPAGLRTSVTNSSNTYSSTLQLVLYKQCLPSPFRQSGPPMTSLLAYL